MNLISCDGCGTVFDKDKLKFPDDVWTSDSYGGQTVAGSKTLWTGERYEAFCDCPVCREPILSGVEV